MRPKVPGVLDEEYESLYNDLKNAANTQGYVGDAAKDAFRLLQPHYQKDHEFALPPLKLIATIANENINEQVHYLQTMSGRVKRDLAQLKTEIDGIIKALDHLASVALREDKREHHTLARNMTRFLRNEIEILYPASILIGEIIALRIEQGARKKIEMVT
ncbi:MAG TPA: hypothetical protein VK436_05720 [Methanocella sp.]|nr:hypothetical protein [Methanocella sp.]